MPLPERSPAIRGAHLSLRFSVRGACRAFRPLPAPVSVDAVSPAADRPCSSDGSRSRAAASQLARDRTDGPRAQSSEGTKARRKPTNPTRSAGVPPNRCADRENSAGPIQHPPRPTRNGEPPSTQGVPSVGASS